MAKKPEGSNFVAVRRLSDKDDNTLALPGETCERVPASSLGWLAERGYVAPVAAAASESATADPATANDPATAEVSKDGVK